MCISTCGCFGNHMGSMSCSMEKLASSPVNHDLLEEGNALDVKVLANTTHLGCPMPYIAMY
eukprot:3380454-Lingulodinium_polyedra.AAC.1